MELLRPIELRLPETLPPLCRLPLGIGMPLVGAGIPLTEFSASKREYVPLLLGVLNSPFSSPSSISMRLLILAERACRLPPKELRGRPRGVRVPDILVRLMGRGGAISVRLDGLAYDEMLARELGRDIVESLCSRPAPGFRFGSGPKDNRLTPEVLSRGTCLDLVLAEKLGLDGVVSSTRTDEAVEPLGRFRERIVTVDGTLWTPRTDERGEARGGVVTGAGSFDRALCTRASRRCIWAVRVLMWARELLAGLGGMRVEMERGAVRGAGVRVGGPVEGRPPDGRVLLTDVVKERGLGVMLCSVDGRRDLRVADAGVLAGVLRGVRETILLGTEAETSDIGGDGGSLIWAGFAAGRASASGGVDTMGELAVEPGEASRVLSKTGDERTERSVDMADR